MNISEIEHVKNDKQQRRRESARGGTQIVIGIVASILVLFNPVTGLLSLHTYYGLTENQTLLIELGYDPADFEHSPGYWIERVVFHLFGFTAILLYVISVASKKLTPAKITLLLCVAYFLLHAYGNIATLSPEARVRGVTTGYWIGKILSWLPKYAVELALLAQGLLGVRKRVRVPRRGV